ncbi:MAG: right-handed parallel beta-helix repeat-containing protein [Cytophagaceae bacterium]
MRRSKNLRTDSKGIIMRKPKIFEFSTVVVSLFVLLFVFAYGEVASAVTYYVSPTGNDSNNGSINAPFKTIQKAADVVNPGDTVIVRDGIYTTDRGGDLLIIKRGGTANAPITFKAENKWKAILDGLGNKTWNGIIITATAPYTIIDGFEIKDFHENGIALYANNITIRNNYIHNIGNYHIVSDYPYCTKYGVQEPGCRCEPSNGIYPDGNNVLIENNVIHTIGKTGWTGKYEPGRYDHAIYGTYVNNLKIINNIILDVWTGKAIDFAASNSIVANNTILRLTEPPSGQPTDSGLMAITGGSNQIVQNNIGGWLIPYIGDFLNENKRDKKCETKRF